MNNFSINNIIDSIQFNLKKNKKILNAMNLFPVPDNNTGSNLIYSLNFHINETGDIKEDLLKVEEQMFSISNNSGGCSGNILLLFLHGINKFYSSDISYTIKQASDYVWDTMYDPHEGMIVDCMKAVPNEYLSIEDFFYQYILNVSEITKESIYSYEDFKENNFVDSGSLGFLIILCSIYKELSNKDITDFILYETIDPDLINKYYESSNKTEYCYSVLSISSENIEEIKNRLEEYDGKFSYKIDPYGTFPDNEKYKLNIYNASDGDTDFLQENIFYLGQTTVTSVIDTNPID